MAVAIKAVLDSYSFKVKDGPTAIVWDQSYGELYKSLKFKTQTRKSMYMSVHYVVQATTKPRILRRASGSGLSRRRSGAKSIIGSDTSAPQ